MAMTASLSVWGMYQYDNTLLDNLVLPDGMNSDDVKDMILLQTTSMSVLYPDPSFFKLALKVWSAERLPVWQKLFDTTQLEYNPIENYDRMEENQRNLSDSASGSSSESSKGNKAGATSNTSSGSSSDTSSGSSSDTSSGSSSDTSSGSSSDSSSGSNMAENSATAYNSNSFAKTNKTESSGSNRADRVENSRTTGKTDSNTRRDSISNNRGENNSKTNTNVIETDSNELLRKDNNIRNSLDQFTSRVHGNIGVTTSQQMIESEREVAQFCMADFIVNDFIKQFCLMVY